MTDNNTTDGSLQARIIIIVFSITALGAISYMLYKRLRELKSKAWTTFRFLIALEAIKMDKSDFDKSLQEIEHYLGDGDWTMAEYWVERVMHEYSRAVYEKFSSSKNVEKKHNYQDLGVY